MSNSQELELETARYLSSNEENKLNKPQELNLTYHKANRKMFTLKKFKPNFLNNSSKPVLQVAHNPSMKRNLSKSFTSLLTGMRKSLFTRSPSPIVINSSVLSDKSKATSMSSICSKSMTPSQQRKQTGNKSNKPKNRKHKDQLSSYYISNLNDDDSNTKSNELNGNKKTNLDQAKSNSNNNNNRGIENKVNQSIEGNLIGGLEQKQQYEVQQANSHSFNHNANKNEKLVEVVESFNQKNQKENKEKDIERKEEIFLKETSTATNNQTNQQQEETLNNSNEKNSINQTRLENVIITKSELDEKLDLLDDLPSLLTNEQVQTGANLSLNNCSNKLLVNNSPNKNPEAKNTNKFKLSHQMSIHSETQSSQISCLNTNMSTLPAYYELKIKLKEGKNLAIRDLCGSSDPYAKFTLNGVSVYKSKIIFKNLNPEWNEEFVVKLSSNPLTTVTPVSLNTKTNLSSLNESSSLQSYNPTSDNCNVITEQLEFFLAKFKLKMFVYDYDRGFLNDDLIGYANIDLANLKENVETSLELELEDEKLTKYEYLGQILLDITLIPKYLTVEKEKEKELLPHNNSSSKLVSTVNTSTTARTKRAPYQLWQCVLNVVLIEGNNLLSMDDNGFSDPYVKFKLENERYRSKTIRRSLNPRFLEQFQLYIYDTNKMNLYISVYDYDPSSNSDDFMGKAQLDLKTLEMEKTNFVKLPLEDGAGTISLLLTITGIYGSEMSNELDFSKDSLTVNVERDNIIRKYGLLNSFRNLDDIGWLQVKVLRAEGLASADMNGKSDPFCSLQLINQYVQTHTEYKTLNPEWGKAFEFNVTDIHAVLEITVLDEDKNKVYEFLGKIEIPIINIQNGRRKFYGLKDRKMLNRAKGAIELEMNLIYNPLKAVLRTFNPREEKFLQQEPKLKVPVLKQNIMRVHNLVQGIINTGSFIDSCFRWVNPVRSFIAFISFILIVLNFEIYMLPLTLLMIFLKSYIIIKLKSVNSNQEEEDMNFDYLDDEEEVIDPEAKEPKKTFRERLAEIQEICLKVQETLDFIASLGERVINTFLFTTPWLSWLAIGVLIIASFILYLIPLRYLILAWGINKFTKKFRKPPDYVDNTEILDFLSRVPSKKELFHYREFRVDKNAPANSSQNQTGSNANSNNKKKKKS